MGQCKFQTTESTSSHLGCFRSNKVVKPTCFEMSGNFGTIVGKFRPFFLSYQPKNASKMPTYKLWDDVSFTEFQPFTVIWDGLGVIYLPNSRFFFNFGDFELISAYFGPYLEPRNTNMPKNGQILWGNVSFSQLSPLQVIWDVLGITKQPNSRFFKMLGNFGTIVGKFRL